MKKYFLIVLVMVAVTITCCIGVTNKTTDNKVDSTENLTEIIDSVEVVADTTVVDSITE